MQPINLREFAEQLRLGDDPGAKFADEILALIDLEADVAEPYFTLCDDIKHHTDKRVEGDEAKRVEWLGDRSDLLDEIDELLKGDGRTGDPDDEVKALIGSLADAEAALRKSGHWTEGDFLDALALLIERAPVLQYDL